MSIPSARGFAVALGVIAACGVSLSAQAGGGHECQERATRVDVEGNGNGQISASEHAANAQKRFEMMDADKNGKVTADEINASHGAESVAWAQQPLPGAEKIKKLDSNKDGALTANEYADGSQRMFHKLDVDGDGLLTSAEMHLEPGNKISARED